MKKIILLFINVYQGIISGILKNIFGINKMCRFSPTCSEYAKVAISRDGIFKGFQKSAIRILRCQPFIRF